MGSVNMLRQEDLEDFPVAGRVYGAQELSDLVMFARSSVVALKDHCRRLETMAKESADMAREVPTAKDIAEELSTLLPQLDPRLLELIEAHVAPKHDDGAFSPALDAEILAERIRCTRIVADCVSPKRLELILSGEDIDQAVLVAGGVSG